MIKRDDMLELTRRMTSSRTNIIRIAGAYIDEEGYIDGTFNISFLSLKGKEKQHCLDVAKEVLFAETNEKLEQYKIPGLSKESIWQLIYAIRDCELKNDALLLNFYEIISENYLPGNSYAIYVYYGIYDVPIKAEDKERLDESEEVYKYLIIAISPTDDQQNVKLPVSGLLYPAFSDRSTDLIHSNIFYNNAQEKEWIIKCLFDNCAK